MTVSGRDENAFNTLYTVLEIFMRVLAPLAPMEAESVWRGLTGGESVHLADWPFLADEKTGEPPNLVAVLVDDPAGGRDGEGARGRLQHPVDA